jgi:hypothetical protein
MAAQSPLILNGSSLRLRDCAKQSYSQFLPKARLGRSALTTLARSIGGHTIWRVLEGLALNRLSPIKAQEYMPGRAANDPRALLLSE